MRTTIKILGLFLLIVFATDSACAAVLEKEDIADLLVQRQTVTDVEISGRCSNAGKTIGKIQEQKRGRDVIIIIQSGTPKDGSPRLDYVVRLDGNTHRIVLGNKRAVIWNRD